MGMDLLIMKMLDQRTSEVIVNNKKRRMPGTAGGGSEVLALVEVQDLPRFNCSKNARDETSVELQRQ